MATGTNRDDLVADVGGRLPEGQPGVLFHIAAPFQRFFDRVPVGLRENIGNAEEEKQRLDGSPVGSEGFQKFQRADAKFVALCKQAEGFCEKRYHDERRLRNWLVERKSRVQLLRSVRVPSRRPTVRSLGISRTPRTQRPTAAPPGEAAADPDPDPDPPDPPEGWLLRGAA